MKRALAAFALAAVPTVVAAHTTSAGSATAGPTTTIAETAPTAAPITSGPMTVTLIDSHYSTAASQLVVVIEFTATEPVEPRGYRAVYVGPDGQQVEALDAIEPDELFPGATAVVVMVFPAATPGGNVMFAAYTSADHDALDVTIPVPV